MENGHQPRTNKSITESHHEDLGFRFEHSYSELPSLFFSKAETELFPAPRLTIFNEALAKDLNLDFSQLSPDEIAKIFTGQSLPVGAKPLAQAYAGHQYGGFTILGDGRALLLGEHRTKNGELFDIQFKGSGITPYSRRGDGRAALGPMLREYIISEAMWHLNIPTTRSLAVATTGENVYRERPLPGAVLTRVASSHIRVGTFQFAAYRRDHLALQKLADYTISRHYPEISNHEDKYLELFRQVSERQAVLIAKWLGVGFIHGVMNTDNMSIAGETIDYGPCAFMNHYHPDTVFSSIDHYGRYCFANQTAIAQWNLVRFAEALLPLIDKQQEKAVDIMTAEVNRLPGIFEKRRLDLMRSKLGLKSSKTTDEDLINDLLKVMETSKLDYTNTWRDLPTTRIDTNPSYQVAEFKQWYQRWIQRLSQDGETLDSARLRMNQANPYIIPRNHRVEEALLAADVNDDLRPLRRLVTALSEPTNENQDFNDLREPPPDDQACYKTFCGT
jgi:uncharacterized protein YdiU (UPF0061 family)